MTEANYSLTVRVNGELLTMRGDTFHDFKSRIDDAVLGLDGLVTDIGILQAAGHVVPAVNVDAPAAAASHTWQQSPPQGPPPQFRDPAPAWAAQPSGQGGGNIEQVTDRYSNVWTYNHPDAPDLPDGRGKYAQKQGTSKDGKSYVGWFDPAKGPKPFAKGTVEAPAIWPKRG